MSNSKTGTVTVCKFLFLFLYSCYSFFLSYNISNKLIQTKTKIPTLSAVEDIPLSFEVWLYLKAGEKVTSELPEAIFWGLVSQQVFILHIERSPVKSEGDMLYVKPGPLFHRKLTGLEAMFRTPFQTRVATRLKWNNYIQQVLRMIKNSRETEKVYIIPQLKQQGWKQPSWLDFFRKRKPFTIPEAYGIVFEERIREGRKNHQHFSPYLHENDWNKL